MAQTRFKASYCLTRTLCTDTHSHTHSVEAGRERETERKLSRAGYVREKIQFSPVIDLCLLIFLISG